MNPTIGRNYRLRNADVQHACYVSHCDEMRFACRLCTNSIRGSSFLHAKTDHSDMSQETSFTSSKLNHVKPSATTWTNSRSPGQPGSAPDNTIAITDPGDIDFDDMEPLMDLILEKDMFNLGFGIEEFHPSGSMAESKTNFKALVLIHQLFAFASRHLAYVHPGRLYFHNHQAVC